MDLFKKSRILKAAADENGAGTFFAMSFAFVCIGVGGLAVDASNVWSVKQRLQSATDISAHAAAIDLVFPDTFSVGESTSDVAISTLLINMPDSKFGTALQASDVVIGYWDPSTKRVGESATSAGGAELDMAVGVTARLDGNVGNVVPTFLLRLIGFDYWQVSTTAVFVRDSPTCFNGGFIAGGKVNYPAGGGDDSVFLNGFCIHGNEGVDFQGHADFGDGVRLSMPNKAPTGDGGMLTLGGTDYTWNPSQEAQVGSQNLTPRLTTPTAINDIIATLISPTSDPERKTYVTDDNVYGDGIADNGVEDPGPLPMGNTDDILVVAQPNAVSIIDCPPSGLDIPAGTTLSDRVIIADCPIKIGADAILENTIIVTTFDGGRDSISAASAITVGTHVCGGVGGEVSLITPGDVKIAAQSAWNGAQVISGGDVKIAANSSNLNTISVEAAGDIDVTPGHTFGLCDQGIDPYATQYEIRMVY